MNLLISVPQTLSYIFYIIIALLMLLLMITVHEFGHYAVGKLLGFRIEEFSIGIGPKLFQKIKKDGEKFSLRLLPLGGYCSFSGEENGEKEGDFTTKKPWQRILVMAAGAVMNYLFAVVLIAIMFGCYGVTVLKVYKTEDLNGYSQTESFSDGDIILSVNNKDVYMSVDIMNAIGNKHAGDKITAVVIRDGEEKEISVVLRADADFYSVEDLETLHRSLGLFYQEKDGVLYGGLGDCSLRVGFFKTIAYSLEYSLKVAAAIFIIIRQLFNGSLGVSSLGGTVTTVMMTAEVIKIGGLKYFLNIASFIGVNLAVFNLLPVPALDGSRIIFTVIEWIRGKPVNRKVEGIIHTVGLVLLFIFAITFDLQHCF